MLHEDFFTSVEMSERGHSIPNRQDLIIHHTEMADSVLDVIFMSSISKN